MKFAVLIAVAVTSLTSPAAASEWREKQVPTHGYAATFPVEPNAESNVENGVKMDSLVAGTEGVICLTMAADYGFTVDPAVELVASRDNFVKGVKSTMTASKRTTFPRGSARLPAIEFESGSDTHNFRSIIVTEGNLVYMVAGGVPKSSGQDADLERCVRGFRLLSK